MTGVFLDTVGLIAVWDTSDQWHEPAAQAFGELLRDRTPLYTSNQILLECGNAAARRPYRGRVNALRRQLIEADLLLEPNAAEWEAAWEAFDRGASSQAGIVDQVSFVLMRRAGVVRAFTNDDHFRAAGFETCW